MSNASLPEIGFITIATLIISLGSLLCGFQTLSDDISSVSGWFVMLICAFPFFGMLHFINPMGVGPTYL